MHNLTWAGNQFFTSSFYYRHVQSERVDVSFVVEGSQAVTIRSLTAHGHPDAIYRVFENGIVLANPSYQPYTFDLQQLSPVREYRRIRGTSTQDPKTNNGRAVGDTVTLGERDALFLIRTK